MSDAIVHPGLPKQRRLALAWALTTTFHVVVALAGVRCANVAGFREVSAFSDLDIFRGYALPVVHGSLPYRDYVVEYPPLAAVIFVLPLVALVPLGKLAGSPLAYYDAFAIQMLLVDAVAVWVVARHVERTQGIERVPRRLAWYTAYFVVLCPMIVTRFDLVPMLAVFGAALCIARGRPVAGGVVAGLGVLAKLIPGLAILPLLAGSNPLATKSQAVKALMLVLGLGTLIWLGLGGNKSLETFRFHAERGIEINSIYASAYMLAHETCGTKISFVFDYGSSNIEGTHSPLVAQLAMLIQLGSFVLVGWQARRARRPYSVHLTGTAVLGFLVGGKVLSPQYLIWLIPFIAVSGSGRWIFLLCCLLTTTVYPWLFASLCNFARLPEALLLVRNLSLIWLFVVQLRARGPDATRAAEGDALPSALSDRAESAAVAAAHWTGGRRSFTVERSSGGGGIRLERRGRGTGRDH